VTDAIPLLLHNLVLIFGVMIVLWGVAVAIKDVSFIDAVWPMGMVLLAATTFWLSGAASPVAVMLLALTAPVRALAAQWRRSALCEDHRLGEGEKGLELRPDRLAAGVSAAGAAAVHGLPARAAWHMARR
jgi:hypothetical protein